jgi:Zn-finger nucleic acid-binding protein
MSFWKSGELVGLKECAQAIQDIAGRLQTLEFRLAAGGNFELWRLEFAQWKDSLMTRLARVEDALNQRGMLKSPKPPAPSAPILEAALGMPGPITAFCPKCNSSWAPWDPTNIKPGDRCPKCSSPKTDMPILEKRNMTHRGQGEDYHTESDDEVTSCPCCRTMIVGRKYKPGDPCPKCAENTDLLMPCEIWLRDTDLVAFRVYWANKQAKGRQ